jgi:prevent-host-death family protein
MKSVMIAELKDHLSTYLRAVERGSEVEVTDRGRPIARIVPVPAGAPSVDVIPPSRPFDEVRDRRRVPARWAVDSTTLLTEERQERRP